MSVCEALREPVAKEAKVLALPRKKGDDDVVFCVFCAFWAIGEVGEGREKAGCDGERVPERSEFCDMERAPIGTVRLLMLESEERGFHCGLR